MNFFCVTPCLNAKQFIKETMLSVLRQTIFKSKGHKLYYTVRDGGSSDGSVTIIKQVIADFPPQKNIMLNYVSEPDISMYDAIVKGFKSEDSSSDIYCYINAGDYYSPYAFEIVADIFANNKQVHFLTGITIHYNQKGHMVNCYKPFFYNKNLLLKGFYFSVLGFVQQESTFWDTSMHKMIDYNKLRTFILAGDYFLWRTFINHTPLYIVHAWLSGFKFHSNQISKINAEIFIAEIKAICLKPNILDYLLVYSYKVMDYLPEKIKKKLTKQVFIYNHNNGQYQLMNKL